MEKKRNWEGRERKAVAKIKSMEENEGTNGWRRPSVKSRGV